MNLPKFGNPKAVNAVENTTFGENTTFEVITFPKTKVHNMHPQTLISFVLINTILAVLLMVPRNIALGQHKGILTLADA